MEYVHAAILLHRAGKPLNEENLTKKSQPASMMVAPAPAAAPTPATGEKPAEGKKEKKKKDEEEKEKEEAAIEGLGALFG